MRNLGNVFLFEFRERMNSKIIVFMNLAVIISILLFFGISHYFVDQDSEVSRIVIINNSPAFSISEEMVNSLESNFDFQIKSFNQLEETREALEAREIDNIFMIEGTEVPKIRSISVRNPNSEAELVVTQMLQNSNIELLKSQGVIGENMINALMTTIEVGHEYVYSDDSWHSTLVAYWNHYVLNWLFSGILLLFIVGYGSMIGACVVNEKSSRVMEVMTSKVKPATLMYGKIFAVLGIALVSMSSAVIAYLLAASFGWVNLEDIFFFAQNLDFSFISTRHLMVGFILITLGFVLFALIYAAIGAACSKLEDYRSITSAIYIFMFIPMYTMLFLNMNSLAANILSYIPIFSPFITFARFTEGYASLQEVVLVILLLIITIILVGTIATKSFQKEILRYKEFNIYKLLGKKKSQKIITDNRNKYKIYTGLSIITLIAVLIIWRRVRNGNFEGDLRSQLWFGFNLMFLFNFCITYILIALAIRQDLIIKKKDIKILESGKAYLIAFLGIILTMIFSYGFVLS